MGLSGSKTMVAPKEAQAMVGAARWEQLEAAYRRIADGNFLDVNGFQKHFLANFPMMVRPPRYLAAVMLPYSRVTKRTCQRTIPALLLVSSEVAVADTWVNSTCTSNDWHLIESGRVHAAIRQGLC